MGVGLNASLSNRNQDITPEKINNETTTSPNIITTTEPTTSTPQVSNADSRWLKPESLVAFLSVFSSRIVRTFGPWLEGVNDPSPINPNTTDNPTPVNMRSMERLEITSQHNTVWNSWSECNPIIEAFNSCLDANSTGEICSVRTRLGSVWIDGNEIKVKQEFSDECDCLPCPTSWATWGSWTECSPSHNCLDTITSGLSGNETCPVRIRSGRIFSNGEVIDVKNETTTEGCNCEPCSFRMTDWAEGECSKSQE